MKNREFILFGLLGVLPKFLGVELQIGEKKKGDFYMELRLFIFGNRKTIDRRLYTQPNLGLVVYLVIITFNLMCSLQFVQYSIWSEKEI